MKEKRDEWRLFRLFPSLLLAGLQSSLHTKRIRAITNFWSERDGEGRATGPLWYHPDMQWKQNNQCSTTPRTQLIGFSSNFKMFLRFRLHFTNQCNCCWKSPGDVRDWESNLTLTLISEGSFLRRRKSYHRYFYSSFQQKSAFSEVCFKPVWLLWSYKRQRKGKISKSSCLCWINQTKIVFCFSTWKALCWSPSHEPHTHSMVWGWVHLFLSFSISRTDTVVNLNCIFPPFILTGIVRWMFNA